MATATEQQFLTKKDLSELLKVTTRTIDRLIQDNKFPKPLRFGRNVRWRPDAIEDWMNQGCPSQ